MPGLFRECQMVNTETLTFTVKLINGGDVGNTATQTTTGVREYKGWIELIR